MTSITVALITAYAVVSYIMFLVAVDEFRSGELAIVNILAALLWLAVGPLILAALYGLGTYAEWRFHNKHEGGR